MDTHPADPPDSAGDRGEGDQPAVDPTGGHWGEAGDDREDRATDHADGAPAGDGLDQGRDPLRFNNWMKRSTTGVLMSSIAVGLQKALELEKQQPGFVIEASDEPDPDGPIQLKFDPDNPAATVAIIRRPPAGDE